MGEYVVGHSLPGIKTNENSYEFQTDSLPGANGPTCMAWRNSGTNYRRPPLGNRQNSAGKANFSKLHWKSREAVRRRPWTTCKTKPVSRQNGAQIVPAVSLHGKSDSIRNRLGARFGSTIPTRDGQQPGANGLGKTPGNPAREQLRTSTEVCTGEPTGVYSKSNTQQQLQVDPERPGLQGPVYTDRNRRIGRSHYPQTNCIKTVIDQVAI